MIDLLRKRRSIRKFLSRPIEPEKIEIIMEALLRSPTSRNHMPWEFIFVTETGILADLAKAKKEGSEFLKEAALGIVILADESKSDVWIEDCSIAGIVVQLTAESLGLSSCWAQIRMRKHDDGMSSEDYIRGLFHLDKSLRVEAVIGIGYPAETKRGLQKEDLFYGKIHTNMF